MIRLYEEQWPEWHEDISCVSAQSDSGGRLS